MRCATMSSLGGPSISRKEGYMNILAIDPGPTKSAWVVYERGIPSDFGIHPNDDVAEDIKCPRFLRDIDLVVIEDISSYGLPVGRDIFVTCKWIGVFEYLAGYDGRLIYRKDVKLHVCGSMRANDATIRQAIIDRYGGKEKAIGSKKRRGPLYGIKADIWQALALAITAEETK